MFKKPIKVASSNPLGGKEGKKVATSMHVPMDGSCAWMLTTEHGMLAYCSNRAATAFVVYTPACMAQNQS
jgi:hypothetical protein